LKTRSIGIRLPVKIWELAKAGAPDMNYSEIVGVALNQMFGFDECEDITSELELSESELVSDALDIESIIDSWEG